jgi:FkbM family methyltransferase
MRLRRWAFRRFEREGQGPIDARLFGYNVRFHPADNSSDLKACVCGRAFNAPELKWLARALPIGGTFVDVGANFGFFTLAAARRQARTLAIEPNPVLFERLTANLGLNGLDGVLTRQAACGAHEGIARLAHARDMGGGHISDGAELGDYDVPLRPLAALVAEAGFAAVDLLKIDIEGYEDRVLIPFLRQAPEALWPASILTEHSSRHLWADDLLGELGDRGYRAAGRSRGNLWLRRQPETKRAAP